VSLYWSGPPESKTLRPVLRFVLLGGVRHGYPWVPIDQAHGHPPQVGPAYQKTRGAVSGPNRHSWRPTRPPDDLPEDSPYDLIQHDLKTRRTRQDVGAFRPKQKDGIWQYV
jgi:hypothetical protein